MDTLSRFGSDRFYGALLREFGSVQNFRRIWLDALRRAGGGCICLVALPDGTLRIVTAAQPEQIVGKSLFYGCCPNFSADSELLEARFDVIDLRRCAAVYEALCATRPRYPVP